MGTRDAGSETQTVEQTIIVGGVGLGIGGHDGSQPVLHVKFESGGNPGHMDAERPAQLPERAPEGPTKEASSDPPSSLPNSSLRRCRISIPEWTQCEGISISLGTRRAVAFEAQQAKPQ